MENGLRYIIIPTEHHSVSIQVFVKAGFRCEEEGKREISHLVEHLVFNRTKKRKGIDLANDIFSHGSTINAETVNDLVIYKSKIIPSKLETILKFFSEILFESVFDEKDIEREKEVVRREISSRIEDPEFYMVTCMFPPHAFNGSPICFSIENRVKDLDNIKISDVYEFYNKYYNTRNIVLSISGNINTEECNNYVYKYFNCYQHKKYKNISFPLYNNINQDSHKILTYKSGSKNASVAVVFPYKTRELSQIVEIISYILSDNMSSRLFNKLRRENGLIYSIKPINYVSCDLSIYGVYFVTRNDSSSIEKSIDIVIDDIKSLLQECITIEDYKRAIESLESSRILELDDSSTLGSYYGSQIIMFDDNTSLISYKNMRESYRNISLKDVCQGFHDLFNFNRMNIGIVA